MGYAPSTNCGESGVKHMEPTITIDPIALGADSWSQLGTLLKSLWLAVLFIVLFASNMILGHILIPSFVDSGHIPDTFRRARPPLYALAILCFAVAMFFISVAIREASVLRNFWPDYWL